MSSPAVDALEAQVAALEAEVASLSSSSVSVSEHMRVCAELEAKSEAYEEMHGKYRHLQGVLAAATEHLEGKLEGERKMRMKEGVKHKLQTKTLQDLTAKYLAEVEARRDAEAERDEAVEAADKRVQVVQDELKRARAHNTDLNLMYLQCKMVKEDIQASFNKLKARVAAAQRRRANKTSGEQMHHNNNSVAANTGQKPPPSSFARSSFQRR